jgi:tripartite ATP-independent transporter DctM subunit
MQWVWGVIGVVVFIVLIICGVRIAFASLIGGLVSFFLVYGNVQAVGASVAASFFSETSSYTLTVIPLFILAGFIGERSGLGSEMYVAARAWVGSLPGGLAVATVLASAFFGAVSGSTVATIALFSRLAYPEMRKAGYDWKLSLGTIVSSGFIDNLIPPSILMVIYGVLADQSIGKLLVAGFLPGILAAAVFSGMIIIRCYLNPKLGPAGPRTSWREKFIATKALLPLIIIIAIIMGGLYGGVFTPTEAGACSAFVILLVVIIRERRFPWTILYESILETARLSAMIFMIVVGVRVMTTALIATGTLKIMVEYALTISSTPWVILVCAFAVWFILDIFMSTLGQLVMTVPFFVPALATAGYDPIWVGVIIMVWAGIALLTPPIAMNLFIGAPLCGVEIGEGVKAIWWFIGMELVVFLILLAFPEIATWLPSRMK